jgi:hypothetical protein
VVLFKIRRYILFLQGDGGIVIDHDNGFAMINTTRYELDIDSHVLPSQYE